MKYFTFKDGSHKIKLYQLSRRQNAITLFFKENLKGRDLKEFRGALQSSQFHKLRWPLSHHCLQDNLSSQRRALPCEAASSPHCHEAPSCRLHHPAEKALSSKHRLKLISLSWIHKAHFDRQMLISKVNQITHSATVTFGSLH